MSVAPELEPKPEHTLHYGITICLMFVGGKSISLLIRIEIDFTKIMLFLKIYIMRKITSWISNLDDDERSRKVI